MRLLMAISKSCLDMGPVFHVRPSPPLAVLLLSHTRCVGLDPEMIQALEAIKGNLIQACLTNNIVSPETQLSDQNGSIAGKNEEIMSLFDFVIASSEQNVRKPDPAFYDLALNHAGIKAEEAVFLDDLGINLKPARELGMYTIKVTNAHEALRELNAVLPINII